jgi:RNA polymerase sigma-70 factor (ECF subfamily)
LAEDREVSRLAPLSLEDEITSFFDELHDPLMRYLVSFRLEIHDAEDVIQEAFFALFRHLKAGKPRTNIRGWAFRVAHNIGLKRQRKTHGQHINSHNTESSADPGLNPEEELLHLQRTTRLQAVVNVLPERDRHCLFLRAEGLRYREIGHVLGISLGSVALALERSLRRLREAESR